MPQLAALFDMDGTLYDSGIDFAALRQELGFPHNGVPILKQLESSPPEQRERGIEFLHRVEAEGAASGTLIPGAEPLIHWLQERGVRCALVTNNSRASADAVLAKLDFSFDVVLTRENGRAKPDPGLFLSAMEHTGVRPEHAVAIGDTHLDALAAHRAGISEILLVALRDAFRKLIPTHVRYKEGRDLADVHRMIRDWHRIAGAATEAQDPLGH